jgi:DNA polymerase-4
MAARTVTVKIRDADFVTATRSHTGKVPVLDSGAIFAIAERLYSSDPSTKPVRLLGVSLSGLSPQDAPGRQLGLELGVGDDF